MTDYASEMAKIFGGACSVENTDWTKERYFDSTSDCYGSEVALLNSLTAEAYNTYGFKVQYFIKEMNLKRDPLMGEDPLENIVRRFELNMYAESMPSMQKQYELQGMVYTEIITCMCSIAHFDEASQIDYDDKSAKYPSYIPKIGDIIYMYYNGIYYEVINVKKFAEGSTFLGAPITYQFSLRVWRNNHEFVDADNVNTDNMDDFRSYAELGETFNLDTKTETNDKTSVVDASSDMLSINKTIEQDTVDGTQNGKPMDNVNSHVQYVPKVPVDQKTDIDPFSGW